MRYFQKLNGDIVPYTDDDRRLAPIVKLGSWTEVRVVPMDAVVIDGPLPDVSEDTQNIFTADFHAPIDLTPEELDAKARAFAAMARYRREHPPVDEEQVKALASDLRDLLNPDRQMHDVDRDLARDLLGLGWTKGGAR
ncbi:hypothetical protein ACFT5B_11835 [Luteimicrobium sp. NPDC057192]|uniref:hypothetical protein n=1 Tax=Luteimicrobium sp. NPDC057192 TaxID=3346042 RepID=UPI003632D519